MVTKTKLIALLVATVAFVAVREMLRNGAVFNTILDERHNQGSPTEARRVSNSPNIKRININNNNNNTDRIWHLMSPQQQDVALNGVLPSIQAHADELRQTPRHTWHYYGRCDNVWLGGKHYGGKSICNFTTTENDSCTFLSFGIEQNYKFDTELSDGYKCHGFAADPTVTHSSQLHDANPGVTFHKLGATTLVSPPDPSWWVASIPSVMNLLQLDHLNILKMDCEGCEYALGRDILLEDPTMLHKIDQVSMEFHLSKFWLHSPEALYYFGVLLQLLQEAGFRLQASQIGGCGQQHELGCMQELQDMNYPGPCATQPPQQLISCHEYLWAKH